jgi:hypothetical protein
MVRRLIVVGALVAGLLGIAAGPADAMCVPGKIGFENGKPVVRLPHCEPPPQA